MGQGTLAYGSMIEVLQYFKPDRMAEWADLLADALGLAVGWGVMRLAAWQATVRCGSRFVAPILASPSLRPW